MAKEEERKTPSEIYAHWVDAVEKVNQERLKLYYTHKAHNSLGIYYQMFPEEKNAWPMRERMQGRGRDDKGRDR